MSARQHNSGESQSGFTLIELLVVIGLMGLLMAFAIPAFQDINRGGAMRTAAFQLNTTLSLARQTAISTRQEVYVVFPDDLVSYTDATRYLAFSSYAVYGDRDGYLNDWQVLPSGVVFFNENSLPGGGEIPNLFTQGSNFEIDLPFPRGNDSIQTLMGFTFRSNGTLGGAGFTPRGIYLTEGIVDTETLRPSFIPDTPILGIEIRPETAQGRAREFNP